MDAEYIIDQYFNHQKSAGEIAEELQTYPNKILRIIKRRGLKPRDKSESQIIALKDGRALHPTEGKERDEETKYKISESVANKHNNFSEEKKESIRKSLQKSWKKRSKADIVEMNKKALQNMSKAGREGSKIENFIFEKLEDLGYNPVRHKKGVIPNSNLEPDIILPDIKLIIEIDGPTHFKPIFGQDRLDKVIASDAEKNALFLQEGFCVLRVKYQCKTLSQYKKRKIISDIVESIEKIKLTHEITILDIEL
jgi:very-short-patch-repair endonuclease